MLPKFAKTIIFHYTERTKEWNKVIMSVEPLDFVNKENPYSFTTKI